MSNGGSAWRGDARRMTSIRMSFRGAKRTRNLEIPRCAVAHLRSTRSRVSRNDCGCLVASLMTRSAATELLARRFFGQRADRFVFGGGAFGTHQMATKALQMFGHFPLGLIDL